MLEVARDFRSQKAAWQRVNFSKKKSLGDESRRSSDKNEPTHPQPSPGSSSMLWRYLLLAVTLLVTAIGCGDSGNALKTATVAGTVTIDGTPVESGTLNFISDQPTGNASGDASAEIRNGQFAAKRVPLGKLRAFIVANKATGKMIPGSSEPVPEMISIVPGHYAQGIEITVAGDEADRKLELTSTP
jgi:hypothetical protein